MLNILLILAKISIKFKYDIYYCILKMETKYVMFSIISSTLLLSIIGGDMSEEVEISTDSNQEEPSSPLKVFQERIVDMRIHSRELGCLGAYIFQWAILFTVLGMFTESWMFLSEFLMFMAMTLTGVAISGMMCCFILYILVDHWLMGAIGYVLPLIAMGIVFPKTESVTNIAGPDQSINLAIYAMLSLLILIYAKKSINQKARDDHELRVSLELQTLFKEYDLETLDSDLHAMLDEAVQDRMDIHEKIYLSNEDDSLLERIGVLEDVDDALCILLKQAKTIMQFRARVSRIDGDSDASSDDQLHSKLNEHMHQFTQKKTVLHELTIDVLGIDHGQIALSIQALQKKREEVALVEKTRKDLL